MDILLMLNQKELAEALFDTVMLDQKEAQIYSHPVFNEEVFVQYLETNPKRVLMDPNYGDSGSLDFTPFRRVNELMLSRGYNTQRALFGISGLPSDILKKASSNLGLNIYDKSNFRMTLDFVLGK